MVKLALRNYSVFLTECFVWKQNIFSRGERTCFQLKVGLSTEAASFACCLASFCLVVCFKRYVKTCRERDDAQKPLNCWSDAFGRSDPTSAHGCFGRPKVWYGCSPKLNLLAKWEYEIVSKRISELLFFFDLCVRKNFWERTNKFECCFFGWVSLTRLKFNTSFFWSYKTVIGFWFDL